MKYIAIVSVLSCLLVLPACSYFDTGDVDVTNADAIDLLNGGGITSTPLAPPLSNSDVFRTSTNGSVEIFDLDDQPIHPVILTPEQAAAERSVHVLPAAGQGFSGDRSVEIYSLD